MYIACDFDLCPFLEATCILYTLQSFGGTHLSIVWSLEVVLISEVENVLQYSSMRKVDQGHMVRPLYRGFPLLGGFVIGSFNVRVHAK